MQTFFIYTDNEKHPLPADRASIPLVKIDDVEKIVAYAGACWGEHNLSRREKYCVAWRSFETGDLDKWLEEHGYRIAPTEDDEI